jgi:hypothetical protein
MLEVSERWQTSDCVPSATANERIPAYNAMAAAKRASWPFHSMTVTGFSFSRILLREPNVTLMAIGDAMMLAGACLAVTAWVLGT